MIGKVRDSDLMKVIAVMALSGGFWVFGPVLCLNHGDFCTGIEYSPSGGSNHYSCLHDTEECSSECGSCHPLTDHSRQCRETHRIGSSAVSERKLKDWNYDTLFLLVTDGIEVKPHSDSGFTIPCCRFPYSTIYSLRSVVMLS